jgi:beta-alanine--pyruvate transaminase
LTRAAELAPYWEEAAHSLKGLPNVIDIRNIGLVGAVEFQSIAGKPGARAYDVFLRCYEAGVLTRMAGDILALSPPLIITRQQIDELFGTLGKAIKQAA